MWLVVPTNNELKKNGKAVMGAGIALNVAHRWPNLAFELGDRLKRSKAVQVFVEERLVIFPTKHRWKEYADLELIERSFIELDVLDYTLQKHFGVYATFLIPRVGCGLGGLDWETEVKPLALKYCGNDPRRIFVHNGDGDAKLDKRRGSINAKRRSKTDD